MPYSARNADTSASPSRVRPSSGIRTSAMGASRIRPCRVQSGHRLEQELEDLDVPPRLREILAPSVQTMPPDQEPVHGRGALEHRLDALRETGDILIVVQDRKP